MANQVVAYLEEHGYQCWIAPRNITSGGDYTDMINDSIRDCRALVLIMSSKSVQSQWVKKELATAVSFNRTIIPFRISSVQLNGGLQFLLNNVQWIDATTGSTASHLPQIIKGIEHEAVSEEPIVDPPHRRWVLPVIIGAVLLVVLGIVLWHPWQRPQDEEAVADSLQAVPIDEKPVVTDTVVIEVPVEVPAKKDSKETRSTEQAKSAKVEQTKQLIVEPEPVVKEEPVVESEPVVKEEEKPVETKTEVQSQTPVKRTPTAAELAAERYNRQFKKAKKFYDVGNYKDALSIFETLKRENPSDSKLDPSIKECRKRLNS